MEINFDNLTVSTHAQQRAIERLQLQDTKLKEVNRYIRKKLSRAEYIGRVTAADGNESVMLVNNEVCFHLNLELTKVLTVMKIENKVPLNPVTDKVKGLMQKEFRKLDRTEKARIKQLELFKCEADVEISSLNLRRYKTRSDSVKFACQARIAALELRRQELHNEIEQIKTDKRQVAKALLTVI